MGLYDSIYLKFKCPYCGEISKMEFQTKVADCSMHTYRKGQVFSKGQFNKIYAYGSCQSQTCDFEAAKKSVWVYGYYGGFSRGFDVIIYCDKGKITNKIKVLELFEHKGIMKGIVNEFKDKEYNLKLVSPIKFNKGGKITDAVYAPVKTNGWLDKFNKDSWNDGKKTYEIILYLYNLEDSEDAMKLWFCFRYRLERILDVIAKEFKVKTDEEMASIFLSNNPEILYKLIEKNDILEQILKL